MAKQYANIQPGFDTFAGWVTKTNNLLDDMSNIVVTIAANSTGGITTGNAYINGTLSSSTGAFNTIRGGNVSTNAALTITSNVSIANSYALTFGNATVNTTVNATSFSGIANSANALTTSRNIALTTDATGNGNFDGTSNLTIAVILANTGVTANTYGNTTVYPVITVDAKGRVTAVTAQTVSTPASGVTSFNTRNGIVSLTAADITGNSTIGLNYTPVSANTSGSINGSLTLTSGDLTVRDILSSRDIRAGNSTVNAVVNAVSISIGNSSVTGVLNSTALAVQGIYANGSLGINGQQLISNGTGIYWSSSGDSTVNTISYNNTLSLNSNVSTTYYVAATGNPTISITGNNSTGTLRNLTLIFNHSGGVRSITFGGTNIKFTDNTAPVLSSVSGATDVLTFFTYDQGVTWNGALGWWSNT